MCGIAGVVASRAGALDDAVNAGLRDAIDYRGRDDEGEWSDGRNVRLFHTRLAVIDLAGGHEPMFDADERAVIVFNGEIYNYVELRKQYEARGARFRTDSDTEVILAGYRLKGPDVCRDFNGMYAFGIWDCERRQLVLGRDELGKKPLFWYSHGGAVWFSSTLAGFKDLPGWRDELSPAALVQYTLLGSPWGETTIYDQASALLPGSTGVVRPGDSRPTTTRFWSFDFSTKARGSRDTLLDEYDDLLTDAVRLRLRSDVPVAITFSGGVDSGSIAAVSKQRLGVDLACYTIDYHTAEDPSAEVDIAERAAKRLGLDWRHIQFDYHADLLPELGPAYRPYDQPCQQLALVYSDRLYRDIKPHATVVLSGNGCDELFTGYVGDERERQLDLVLGATRWMRPLLARTGVHPALRLPPAQAFAERLVARAAAFGGDPALHHHVAETIAREADDAGVGTRLDLTMFVGLRASAGDANYRLPDISGLAAQVEVRCPFLDKRMVDFAARLPHRLKVGRVQSPDANKYLPKLSYERVMDPDIAWASKKGMGWNLRWHESIAVDPAYRAAVEDAFTALDEYGVPSAPYREAWTAYSADIGAGRLFSPAAGPLTSGFMLGAWLRKERLNPASARSRGDATPGGAPAIGC